MYHATRKTVEEDVVQPVKLAMDLINQALKILDTHPDGVDVVKIKNPKYFIQHLQSFAGSLLSAAARAPRHSGGNGKAKEA